MILAIAYAVLGYWAVGKTVYANKVVVYSRPGWLFTQKSIYALLFGWVLIPIALLKALFGH